MTEKPQRERELYGAVNMERETTLNIKRFDRIFGLMLMFFALLTLPAAGAPQKLPHSRSSEIMDAPHDIEKSPPEPQRIEARPRPVLPTVPLGYEGSEHKDGIHHGDDGHHNWHLKGGRR